MSSDTSPTGPIDKEYRPEAFEAGCYSRWLELGVFRPRPADDGRPFVIVIPPPNITGRLHVGHALNNTLQDVLIRWRRMQGVETLWLPGMDHAGIATQMVVERSLAKQGVSRHEIGRERFLEEVWKWKEHHAGEIVATLQRLGCSCDWERMRFTLDEGLSRAVREVFVSLYEERLIYREEALVNWCPSCRTALSDLEVDRQEGVRSHIWKIAYPIRGTDRKLVVATTRPETMLGDTGVAVHPDDERYRELIGSTVVLPLLDRPIPVIADGELVDPAFGTGVVKVTPAHDFNDFLAGKRNGLPAISILDEAGRVNENGGPYAGLDRFEARERVVADLEAAGLLLGVEEHSLAIAVCDRCSTVLEPRLSTQWFVRIAPLAAPALAAVEEGRVELYPESWKKTYYEWMRNIHDWCISRQLWWGHRIPAWYCPDGHVTVARETPDRCSVCPSQGEDVAESRPRRLRQDDDVLDTWFSSALWPFSTLGWPEQTGDLDRYYPTSVLITGPDILFFWVARMIMMGLRFAGGIPFDTVYLHGLVRDARGEKMSKTRGNAMEPEAAMKKYGTDALRFTLSAGASPGPSVPLSDSRLDGYRAFANKIWNATRFVLMNLRPEEGRKGWSKEDLAAPDRWILSRSSRVAGETNRHLESFRFDLAASTLYQFAWHSYCDWYIEMAKPWLAGEAADTPRGRTTRAVLVHVLDDLLRMLHPFMPFVTEELWQRLPSAPGAPPSISVVPFPSGKKELLDPEAEQEIEQLIEVVTRVRNLRAEAGIDPAVKLPLRLVSPDPGMRRAAETGRVHIERLARLGTMEISDTRGRDGEVLRSLAGRFDVELPLEGIVDTAALRERLTRELGRVGKDLASRRKKLGSEAFLDRAPEEIVEKERRIEEELATRSSRLSEMLEGLGRG